MVGRYVRMKVVTIAQQPENNMDTRVSQFQFPGFL